MNPLTNIEVERLMSVLSQTNRNLEILCYVPLDLISSNNNNVTNKELFQELPESLVRHIESHIKLLGERTNSNLPKAIKQSTRSLCRTLINDKRSCKVLSTSWKTEQLDDVIHTMERLMTLVNTSLSNTEEKDHAEKERIHDLQTKILQRQEDLAHLTVELRHEKEAYEEDMERYSALENKLQGEVEEVRANAEQRASFMDHESTELDFNQLSGYEKTQGKIDEGMAGMVSKMQNCRKEAQTVEHLLRTKRTKMVNEVYRLKTLCNDEVERLTQETQNLEIEFASERAAFGQLSEYYRKIDQDHAIEAEEKCIIAQALEVERQAEAVLDKAATRIQARIRGYQTRANLRKKNKKKKGKGKKGGNKKK